MKKTLLLVFIHGFKGGDSTFAEFPSHLAALLHNALPRLSIETAVYPKYETRGDLPSTVSRFQEWLSNKVIDIEVQLGTPSPTIDPGVRVILVGHSMGGIVGAEALRAIAGEKPISWQENTSEGATESAKEAGIADPSTLMFPYIQGLLAFDTPYLGLSPGVVAHGAEGHWNTGKALYETAAGLFATSAAATAASKMEKNKEEPPKALEATPEPSNERKAASTGGWQKWGKLAAIAGAASAAVAAGGTAAYLKRDQITEGVSWVGSHLEFVGCLARGEELKQRIAAVNEIHEQRSVGFANLYTCLASSTSKASSMSSQSLGQDRTFCVVPKSDLKRYFYKAINDKASDETTAHMCMFVPQKNPGFYDMGDHAKELISSWVSKGWYETADLL